jgi:hypothetical protein
VMFISRRDRYQPSRDGDPCELPHPWAVSQPKTHGPRRVFPIFCDSKEEEKRHHRTDRHGHDRDCARSMEWRFLGRAARRPPVSLRSVEVDGYGDEQDEACAACCVLCVRVRPCLPACFSVTMILLLPLPAAPA